MRRQRRSTNSDFIERTRDIDYLRERLAESFAVNALEGSACAGPPQQRPCS